ncbi:MAG: 3-dehydroquinate synthase, partial [Actinobacteria bacterium]|nr:3-dehydroquinate synthase [Actinomycetota bacterium]
RSKASVVQADEREAGPRESLNLGHTLAHAIEKVAGYGVIPHGLAVAAGLRFAAGLSVRLDMASEHFGTRQVALLDALGLSPALADLDVDAVRYAMRSDKKVRAGEIRFVFATEPGSWVVVPVDERTIADELNAFLAADIERHKSM